MRTITTPAGTPIELDGDVLAVIEAVWGELVGQQALDFGFEDVHRIIGHLVSQMSEAELRDYLRELLFMSFSRYENERLTAVVRRAQRTEADPDVKN